MSSVTGLPWPIHNLGAKLRNYPVVPTVHSGFTLNFSPVFPSMLAAQASGEVKSLKSKAKSEDEARSSSPVLPLFTLKCEHCPLFFFAF